MRLLKALSSSAASRFALMVEGSKLRRPRGEDAPSYEDPSYYGDIVKPCTRATIRCR